jgi:hypothetical protein
VLWEAWQRYHDQPDGDVVLVQAPTHELNPAFDASAVANAYEDDPLSAAAEYGAQFRSDVSTLITREALDACIISGRFELPFIHAVRYCAFLDFAGGSGGDSATLAIAHAEHRQEPRSFVLDVIREHRPPFSPEAVCKEFADVLKAYRLTRAISDKWGGQFPIEQMKKHGIFVEPSAKPKSDLYIELLPLLNSGRVELLDVARLRAQLASLERRTARGGRDSIDHAPGGHDDVANAAAGCLVLASLSARSAADDARDTAFLHATLETRVQSPWRGLVNDGGDSVPTRWDY